MLGSFLLANILTGLVNLSVDTLSASSLTAFMILSVYTFTLCMVTGLAHFFGVRMKFWWICNLAFECCMYSLTCLQTSRSLEIKPNIFMRRNKTKLLAYLVDPVINSAFTLDLTSCWLVHFTKPFPRKVFKFPCVPSETLIFLHKFISWRTGLLVLINTAVYSWSEGDTSTIDTLTN